MSYANIDKTFNLALANLKNVYSEENIVTTRFWSREVTIDLEKMHFKPEFDIISKILICHYLISKSNTSWNGSWISFKELPDGEIYNIPFQKRTIIPLIKMVNNDLDKLKRLKEKLAGEEGSFGDLTIILNPFPELYLAYIYWVGDEEFPANANILFSSNFPDYLPTEDCVILASSVVWQLKTV